MISKEDRRVTLVVPPFQTTVRPALGVSQLKSNLQKQGFPTKILYLNLLFAERIGLRTYELISKNYNALFGDFIFSDILFKRSDAEVDDYVSSVLKGSGADGYLLQAYPDESLLQIVRRLMQEARKFCCEDAIEKILETDPWMVGLTSSYVQNCSSLALIRTVKENRANVLTAMGGANCESDMGEELFKLFPEIDYIGQGECDHSFVDLVSSLGNRSAEVPIPGILTRSNGKCHLPPKNLQSHDLDNLPYPDFEDYFEQLNASDIGDRIVPGLVMETSRGCWWGAKNHCTFCGANGTGMGFRSKNAVRAMEELTTLVDKYHAHDVCMADNIIDMKYFKDFIPALAERPVADVFYETKANLKKSQVKLLKKAKITMIQPGIESLSDESLMLMKKGTTKIQNIQVLKWFAEYGIQPCWNYLYGFPGESEEEINVISEEAELLHHIPPPEGAWPLRIDRFSPYFTDPETYGIAPLRHATPYHHVYPFSDESLRQIAYFYQSDYGAMIAESDGLKTAKELVAKWNRVHSNSYLLAVRRKNGLVIIDTRLCAKSFLHRLDNEQRQVYEFCDEGHTFQVICENMEIESNDKIQSILDGFVENKLVLYSKGRYLSLANNQKNYRGRITIRTTIGIFQSQNVITSEKFLSKLKFTLLHPPSPSKIFNALACRASNKFQFFKSRALNRGVFLFADLISKT